MPVHIHLLLLPVEVRYHLAVGSQCLGLKNWYATHSYIADYVTDAKAAIESMKMLPRSGAEQVDRAELKWRLQVGVFTRPLLGPT